VNAPVPDCGSPFSALPNSADQPELGVSAAVNPIEFSSLSSARTCYGRSTIVWAGSCRHHVEDDWWIGLSGTPYVDYNLALLHGDRSVDAAPQVLSDIQQAGVPSLIMLAGAGLGASQTLTEAGWVCTGTLPFMGKRGGLAEDDANLRRLAPHELAMARSLAAAAFGVPEEVGAIAYADDRVNLPGYRTWGLFEGDELMCCLLTMNVEGYSVGWALATAPEHQRAGYGRRLLRALAYRRLHQGPRVGLLMATNAALRLYRQEGYVALEHWQIWSRPRWVLR
jgi:GNAT superfamily N-acetyltransferase